MSISNYNLETIIAYTVCDKSISTRFIFKKEKVEGFYSTATNYYVGTKDQMINGEYIEPALFTEPKKYIVENNIVYSKPCVYINFMNNINVKCVFGTYNEAVLFGEDIEKYKGIPNSILIVDSINNTFKLK